MGKGENAGNQHFILFPQYFLPLPKQIQFFVTFFLLSANALNLDWSKILVFGKELGIESALTSTLFYFFQYPKSVGKFEEIDSGNEMTTEMIIERIIAHR